MLPKITVLLCIGWINSLRHRVCWVGKSLHFLCLWQFVKYSFSFLKISMNFLGFSLFNVILVIFSNKNISYNLPYICWCKRHSFKIFYYQCVCTVCVSMCVAVCVWLRVCHTCVTTHMWRLGQLVGITSLPPPVCGFRELNLDLRLALQVFSPQRCLSSLAFLYTAVSSLLLGRGCRWSYE